MCLSQPAKVRAARPEQHVTDSVNKTVLDAFYTCKASCAKKHTKKKPKKNPTTTCKSLTLEQSTIVYYLLPHLRNITHFLPSTMFYQATQLILQ